jgi:general secretion pathway protein G
MIAVIVAAGLAFISCANGELSKGQTNPIDAQKKRLGEVIKELLEVQQKTMQDPEMIKDIKIKEKCERLAQEGDALMIELTKGDKTKEDALVIEVVEKYIPEYLERMKDSINKRKLISTEIKLHNVRTTLELYYLDNGRYPTTEEGLKMLINPGDSGKGPYLSDGESALTDSWGNYFIYRFPGDEATKYFLKSLGPDGKENTKDDINSK